MACAKYAYNTASRKLFSVNVAYPGALLFALQPFFHNGNLWEALDLPDFFPKVFDKFPTPEKK
jgi:hypothetical protein